MELSQALSSNVQHVWDDCTKLVLHLAYENNRMWSIDACGVYKITNQGNIIMFVLQKPYKSIRFCHLIYTLQEQCSMEGD